MGNIFTDGNIKFVEMHGNTVKRLSPSTVIVYNTSWMPETSLQFDSLLTRKPEGGYQEITLQGGTLTPVSDPVQLDNLRHFLNY